MRYIIAIVIFGLSMTVMMNYNFKYDAANPQQSIHRMTYFMSTTEQIEFQKTLMSVCQDNICSNLDGLTVDEIKKEAARVAILVLKKNIVFLENYIKFMKAKNKTSTNLHINTYGIISEPRTGFIYRNNYSIEELKRMLVNTKEKLKSTSH